MAVSNLNEGENSFRRLAENLPGIVYRVLIEDDNRTVFFNDMVQTMTGYSPKDLRKGKVCSIDPLILPEDRVNVLNIIKDAIENNVPFEVEYRINTKGGEVKWFFERGRPIRRDNGNPSYIDGVIFDITKRKEAEKKLEEGKIGLRESEKKFKFLVSSNPAIIYTSKVAGDFGATFISDNVQKKWGYSSEDFVNDSEFWLNHVHPDDKEHVITELSKLSEKERRVIYDYRFKLSDGSYHWMRDEVELVKDEEGNPIETIGSVIDINDRKEMEQELKESEEKYRLIFENANDAISILDLEGNFYEVNNLYCTRLGYTREEILKSNIRDVNVPDYADLVSNRILEIGKIGFKVFESAHKAKDGSIIPVEISSKSILYEKKPAILNILRDITERRKAEEALRESEQRLKDAQNLGKIGDWEFDVDKQNLLWSDQVFNLYKHDRTRGMPTLEEEAAYYSPKEAKRLREYAQRAIEYGQEFEYDIEANLPDGSIIQLSALMRPIKNKSGRVTKLIGTVQDITARKIAEENLKKSQKKYKLLSEELELILDHIGSPVFYKDTKNNFIWLNKYMIDAYKMKKEDLIGKSMFELYPEKVAQTYWDADLEVINSGKPKLNIEEHWDTADGLKWLLTSKIPYIDENGDIEGIIGISVDITERKIAEQKLRESEEKLRKQNVFLNNILESLTHPFYVIDVKDYRIVLANTAAGLEGIEHGTYCYSRTHNTNKPCEAPCVCPLEEVIKTKKTCVVEHVHFDKEGNEKFFDVYGYPILDENGNVVQMIEYGFDVTEAKIAQQELKKSEEKYRHLFDNSPYYIILLDKEGNFIDCNNATVDIYGYSKEDFIDKNFKEMPIIPFELIPTLENKMESLLKGELMSPIEFIPITKDGNLIWINSQASLIKLGNEFFIFIIGQDITERKKAERKIKESEENYRDLANQWRTTFDAMNEAVFLLDLEQNILQCNKASLDILGKEQYKEIIGHTCCEIVHGTDEPVEWCPMVRMIKSRHEESSIAQIGDRWCEISVDPVINEEGTLIGAVHIITDITERRKTEVALRESEERFRNLIEQSVDGIVIVNEDGLIIEWNKSQEQIIGLKREEVLGIPIWDVQFQAYSEREKNLEQYEKFKSMMEDVLKSGEAPWLGKLRDLNIIRADNNKNRIIQQLPFLIKTQKKIMLSSFSRDITEQKLIQEENQEKQATLESIFRASPIGIGMVKNRVLNQVNDRFCNIVGYTQDELLNKSARIVYPSDEEYELVGKIKYDRINKLGIGTVETKFLRKDGKIIDVLVSSVPLDLNDHSVGVTFTTLDITERKKVERELLESEQKFRTIAEQSFMGIIILQDGLFKYFNQRAADINGYSVEEIQNWKPHEFANLIHPEDREFVMEQARKKQGGETDVINFYKYRVIKKSGEIAWFDNYSKTINYEGRSADLIMTEDITDKIKAEQELKESEKKYRHLFESSPYFIGLIDEDGTLVDSNSSISKFLSMRTKEDVIGKNILEILSIVEENKEIIPLLQNIFQEAHSNEPVKSHEFKLYRSTGGFLWLKVEGSTVEINNQKLLQFIVQDITNRKIIEEELKESEQKFRTIAEQSFMGIIISQDNKIKYANKALLNLFEFSEKEILNWSDDDLTNLIHPEDLSFLKEYRKYLRHGETSQKPYFSYRVFTKLGKIKWIDQFSKKIQYKGGPAELVTIIDVTEKKEVEEKLIKLNNMKSELLRRTSHELRTPLVSIKGFSDLLLELHRDKLDKYVVRTIEQIRSGCYRLESLVNDILKTSELESGTVGLKKSKEDLSLLIKICVSDLEGLTKLRNHSINLEISDDLICSFEKKQIYNVITNLLSNAIKYTPISGRIEVKSEITNGFIIISIQDNGIGFTKEEKDQIFKKFGKIERYGQGYDIISEGSGLGLYISKKIVEMHGGGVWLESEGRDRGSTFYFSLPVA